jgi:hypothetical protein
MMMDFESETRVGWYKDTTLKWLNGAFVGLFILIWQKYIFRITEFQITPNIKISEISTLREYRLQL